MVLESAPNYRNGDSDPHKSCSSLGSHALDGDYKVLRKVLQRKRKCGAQLQGSACPGARMVLNLGQSEVNSTCILTYLVRVTVWKRDWLREGMTLVTAVKHL